MAPDLDPSEVACRLESAGFAACGTLPEDHIHQVVELCGPMKPDMIWNPHEKWEAVRRIAYDPKFLDVARKYLRVEPIVCSSRAWWTVPPAGDQDDLTAKGPGPTFHFDVPDCKSLILFVYLSDVWDRDYGPHSIIEGTHNRKTFAELVKVNLDEDVAAERFGSRIKTVYGKKGTFFFEELTVYHKGEKARKPRLILGIHYTLRRRLDSAVD